MVNVVCIPYRDLEEKQKIFQVNKNIKFMDLGNCLMNIENVGADEMSVGKLCWLEKNF